MNNDPSTRLLPVDDDAIAAAVRCLSDGGLVAFPTETVYGLGADAQSGTAVARLYAAKGRPAFNPLIAHVATLAAARQLACFDAAAERLAAALWPGPLTLVLPKAGSCPLADLATAGLDSVAVRIPNHPVARALLTAFGRPVVAPSANRSGHVSPTTAAHVLADLGGRIDLILDGGPTAVGIESTIVACLDRPTLLRPGGVPRETIERVIGGPLAELPPTDATEEEAIARAHSLPPKRAERPLSPGRLASHYAPRCPLRLNATGVAPEEGLLAFGTDPPRGARVTLNLSERGDLIEAAANLFSHLRALDSAGVSAIAVMPIPRHGLGEAINDRLARAAAPRR
ncbi:MAG: threonylcarbamoyl-AMP synthase [Hyphomicrobiales bacterium]|nr:threonylcarbamoyl-AMP synthase [Hyphomicrobiales bacterium]